MKEEITQDEIVFVKKLYDIMKGYEKYAKKVNEPDEKNVIQNISQILDVPGPKLENVLTHSPEKISYGTIRNIRLVREIFSVLGESLTRQGIYEWLGGCNQYLGKKQPLELLLRKDYQPLRDAVFDLRDSII